MFLQYSIYSFIYLFTSPLTCFTMVMKVDVSMHCTKKGKIQSLKREGVIFISSEFIKQL